MIVRDAADIRRQVDLSITVFRAGLIALIGVLAASWYLAFVATPVSAIMGGLLLLLIPAGCFLLGASWYVAGARVLRAVYGENVSGLLRPRSANLLSQLHDQVPLTSSDEASWVDIISRLGEDKGR